MWARKHYRALALASLVFLLCAALLLGQQIGSNFYFTPPSGKPVQLKHQRFYMQVADTAAKRSQGLSGQAKLPGNHGMLFVFDSPEKVCIWMKDMKFDLDILWFDAAGRLVHQKRGASPASYPESYCTDVPATYVVEVVSGTAERMKLEPGDTLKLL